VARVRTYSDHRLASFGLAYGVLIKELKLLARAVFVVDRAGIVRYVEMVKELADQPDYEAVLQVIKKIADLALHIALIVYIIYLCTHRLPAVNHGFSAIAPRA
jgi:hypothetical protein